MRSKRTIPLALVAMSLLLFHTQLTILTETVLRFLGLTSGVEIALVSLMYNNSLLALLSLCGGVAFLMSTREENPSWYLGIPLVVAYAVIIVSPVSGGFIGLLENVNPLLNSLVNLVIILLLGYGPIILLPPCAALFFWSQKHLGRGVPVITGITCIITLNSLVFASIFITYYLAATGLLPPPPPQYIDGHLVKSDGEGLLFLFLAIIVGLPAIGICFLALAAYYRYTARKAFPARTPVPEAQP
ncbi:MAG: hypothetical protein M0Q92_12330 [Methanoregula sp.]|jgi:hypothetical protein|nr:hypothetical protein [Methanoregula sp.]